MASRTFGEKFLFACSLFAILCVACLCATQAHAQVAGAALSGTIADPSGALVPNAKISVRNTATNVTRELTTDSAGFYTVPNLLPGTYEITVSAGGFATEVRTGIGLEVGAQQVLNVTLKVGSSTEKVEVTGEAPRLSCLIRNYRQRELDYRSRIATQWPLVDRSRGIAAGGRFRSDAAILRQRGRSGQPRFRRRIDNFRCETSVQ